MFLHLSEAVIWAMYKCTGSEGDQGLKGWTAARVPTCTHTPEHTNSHRDIHAVVYRYFWQGHIGLPHLQMGSTRYRVQDASTACPGISDAALPRGSTLRQRIHFLLRRMMHALPKLDRVSVCLRFRVPAGHDARQKKQNAVSGLAKVHEQFERKGAHMLKMILNAYLQQSEPN